ncbi:membrane protein [Amylibacter marinus]|uniref:Membrane protein n=1 Tax=Amylibacter marinus TaxID=1475483 RepID=A0ABQ5VSX0_9RHOB|nr:DUF4105 domain-containing protein [Amylibacter marinus]GLQ34419.1 membrane protein [Amylibacter marinus]
MGLLIALGIAVLAFWGFGAIWFRGLPVLGVLYGILALAAIWGVYSADFRFWIGFALASVVLCIWWIRIEPRLDLNWQEALRHTVTGQIEGDIVRLHNIRDFDWQADGTVNARWYDDDFRLSEIASVDVILSYWDSPRIAHTLVSFGFQDGRYVTFSVEIRKQVGQEFSTIGGFFKEYELAFVAATERDIVRLRTSVRDPREEVYLYPIKTTLEDRIDLFKAYVERANQLAGTPEFYHTITANCTTVVYALVKQFRPDVRFDKSILVSGDLPEMFEKRDMLDWDAPLGDVRARARINARADAVTGAEEFSHKIRE